MNNLSFELEPYTDNIDNFANTAKGQWPEWYYHNFIEHGLRSVYDFFDDVECARVNGVDISTHMVVAGVLSLLEHDMANDDFPPILHKYYEERSATIGDGIAKHIGFGQDIIDLKRSATLATRPGSNCTSLLDIMVRRADLANLAWVYDEFKAATINLWRESQLQARTKPAKAKTFKEWVCSDGVKDIVMKLLDEDLSLGDFDRNADGLSFFQEKVFQNFQALHDDVDSPKWIEPELFAA